MPQAVGAAEVVDGAVLFLAQVGADRVGLLEHLLGPGLGDDGLHDPVVVTGSAKVFAPREGAGEVAVGFGCGAAYDVG